jgi:hypothetical protein
LQDLARHKHPGDISCVAIHNREEIWALKHIGYRM